MEIISSFVADALKQLQSWPNEVLLFAAVIVIGYVVKGIPQIPNQIIPGCVIALAAIGEVFMGNPGQVDPGTNPTMRLALIGAIIGCAAWMFHAQVLKRVQDKFGGDSAGKLPLLFLALLLPLGASAQQIAVPEITFVVRTNFPQPVIDESGFPTGQYTNSTKVVVWWYAIHADVGWDFLYRTNVIWLKPAIVSNTRELGTGRLQKALLLDYFDDYDERYEFLPVVTVNPHAR